MDAQGFVFTAEAQRLDNDVAARGYSPTLPSSSIPLRLLGEDGQPLDDRGSDEVRGVRLMDAVAAAHE